MMLKLKIVTPERVLIDQEVDSITLPTSLGEITVLPNHVPLIANLVAGEIRYRKGQTEEVLATSSGVIEVNKPNEVVVLAQTAELGSEIDLEQAEKARERATQLMKGKAEKTYATAAASLEKHLARLKVARKHRTRTSRNLESGVLNE